ncbi:MAG TPA: NnrU family protein [Flavisolibacter sp.]|nr:NnrU family protein [Flavisolibacter sp.]
MPVHFIFLAVLWTLYCVLHSVLAGSRLKKNLKNNLGERYKYYRPAYILFAFASLIAIVWYQLGLGGRRLFEPGWFAYAGLAIMASGLLLMLVCIRKYFMSLSGLRSLMNERHGSELMISGIHKYVRHPLYLGTFAFLWGLFLALPELSLLISNTIITAYTLLGIRFEEKKLEEEFGESYRRYREQVPKLLPTGNKRLNKA